VTVVAKNTTDFAALAGAATFSLGSSTVQSKSVGIAGSLGVNIISGTTEASITDVTISRAQDVFVDAARTGDYLSITAGGSGSARQAGISVAGSVSWNELDDTTDAFLDAVDLTNSGGLRIEATNSTTVLAIAGAGAFTLKFGSQSPGSTGSVGLAVGVNRVTSDVSAYSRGSTSTAGGNVTVSAESTIEIEGYAYGGALSVSTGRSSSGSGLVWDGAGGGAGNDVTNTIEAYISGGSVTTTAGSAGSVSVSATDKSVVDTDAGGFGLALSLASQGSSQTVSVGISVGINDVENTTDAYIDAATVDADGSVGVTANSLTTIEALTIAGALTGVQTGGTGISGSGAGAGSGNTVRNTGRARVRNGSTVTADGTVTVAATDALSADEKSRIEADAGGVAIALALASKSSTTVNVTFGVSVAINDIENTIESLVDDSTVTAGGDLALSAVSDIEIDALTIAGALSGTVASQQGGLTVDIAGAGAGSGNTITNTVSATIENGSTVTTTGSGDVSLLATDDSTIGAIAGAVSLAASFSKSTSANLSFGASAAVNEITNTVEAGVDDSTVDSDGGFSATAETTATIDALTVAGAGGGTIVGGNSGLGLTIAGAGTGSGNDIANTTRAFIENGSDVTTDNDGAVVLDATNASTITADAIAGSLAISYGGSTDIAIAVGIAIGVNDITDITRAVIDDSTVASDAGVGLDSDSTAVIEALSVGAAISVAASGQGKVSLAGSGAGGSADNSIANTTEAYIAGGSDVSTGAGDALTITVTDENRITADAAGGSIAASFAPSGGSFAAAVGVGLAENEIGNTVRGYISGGTVTAGSLGISVATAPEDPSEKMIDALAVGVAVSAAITNPKEGISVALSGAGAQADNTIENTVSAFVDGGATVTTTGDVNIEATEVATISADVPAISVAIGVLAAAVGVSLSENTIDSDVHAYVGDATLNAGSGDVAVRAASEHDVEATTTPIAISIGIGIAGAGADAITTIDGTTEAWLGDGADIDTTGDVAVTSYTTAVATAEGEGGGAGALSFDVLLAEATIGQHTRAHIDDGATVDAGDLTVATYGLDVGQPGESSRTATASVVVGNVALVGANGANTSASITGDVEAYIDAGAVVTLGGAALVDAVSVSTADSSGEGGSGGIVTASVMFVAADISGDTRAWVGDDLTLESDSLTVSASADEQRDGRRTERRDRGGRRCRRRGDRLDHREHRGTGRGRKDSGATGDAVIKTGALVVSATTLNTVDVTPSGGAGGGVAIGGFEAAGSVGDDDGNGATRAYIGDGARIVASASTSRPTGRTTSTSTCSSSASAS
jgi:hypothetical protein